METQTTMPALIDESKAADEVNTAAITFTPLKIGADGSRSPYDTPPSFEQLRSDLLSSGAVVIMNGVNLPALYAKHAQEDDPTAYYDNGQAEIFCLLESARDTDPDIAELWLDAHSGEDTGLCMSETANGEPELTTIEAEPSLEEVLGRIQEQKKIRYEQRKRSDPHVVERYRRRNSVSDRRMHDAILAGMRREPDRKHAKHELEAYAEMAGLSYRAVPFHLTCMVTQGKIERAHFGWYRLPSSAT